MTTLNELKHQIADIISEAKKKADVKGTALPKKSPQIAAFGHHDEEHDFSIKHDEYGHSTGFGANWGPSGTGDAGGSIVMNMGTGNPNSKPGGQNMKENDEKALRAVIREVIQNGLIDEQSAWAPFLKKAEGQGPIFESSWEEAHALTEKAWYDKKEDEDKPAKKGKGYDKSKPYGSVKPHGEPKKKK